MSTPPLTLQSPPAPLADLIGRDREGEDVASQLASHRLVTLTGAGGSGKTRLALEVTSQVASSFPDGVAWVDLAPLDDPGMVARAVAGALGVVESSRGPLPATLSAALRPRRLLLCIDNGEHLADACAELLTTLLHGAPHLHVLVTSRCALRVPGERSMPVAPLGVPRSDATTADEVRAAPSARLFERRAQEVRPGFTIDADPRAVTEICRRLDGLPLAVELAAARTGALSPAQVAAGLDDRFALLTVGYRTAVPRHRTLAACVAWSTDLLDDSERRLLARLSVFGGRFDLEAARAVAPRDLIGPTRVLDLLTTLVHNSLVQIVPCGEEVRYRLLETIREHARLMLAAPEDATDARHRHVDHYVNLAIAAHRGLIGPEPQRWLDRLDHERDDLRLAMDRALAMGRPDAAIILAEAGLPYWQVRGLYAEVRRRLQQAIASPDTTRDARARGMTTASILALMAGDFADGHHFADDALHVLHEDRTTDPDPVMTALEARAHGYRAWCGYFAGERTDASVTADLDEARELAATAAKPEVQAQIALYGAVIELSRGAIPTGLQRLATVRERMSRAVLRYLLPAAHTWAAYGTAAMHGELTTADEHARVGLEQARQLGLQAFVTMAHSAIATIATLRGDQVTAHRHLRSARETAERHQLPTFVMIAARWEAFAAHRFGTADLDVAAETAWTAAVATGSAWDLTAAQWLRGMAALRGGDHEGAREYLTAARDASRDPRYPFSLARAMLGLAVLAHHEGEQDRAWILAHDALEVLADHGDRVAAAEALELIAELATERSDPRRALGLLGAADEFRRVTGVARAADNARAWPRRRDAAMRATGKDAAAVLERGRALGLDDAIARARRGRGRRGRPDHGWDALTPTERAVVRLVADGCANSEIAEQLFVSLNTVKTHLSSVYTKTGASSRQTLAVEAATRLRATD